MASHPIIPPISSQEEHDELLEIAVKCPICDTYSDCTSSTHKCKICKKVGEVHEARHCKELCVCGSGNDHSLDDHVCFECGKKGFQHLRSQCPYACPCDRKGHTSEEHVCVVCEEVGFSHMNDRCPKMCPCGCRNPKDEHKCSICKLVGFSHMEWMCPERCICEDSLGLGLPANHHYKKHYKHKARYTAWEKRTIPPQEGSTMEDMVATRNANDVSKCPCGQPHSADTHICGCCNRKGFHHYFYECPKLCPCGSNQHSVDKHRCKKCHKVGFSHFMKDCPLDYHHIYHDGYKYCVTCKENPATHRAEDCPERCGCGAIFHTSKTHECEFCDTGGFDHFTVDCKERCLCGCGLTNRDHKCRICGVYGFDHLPLNCPRFGVSTKSASKK